MNAVLLAAGFGTRLHPLTRDRAKPLLPVGGRPVVERLLERVLEAPSIEEVVVVTNGRFEDDFRGWLDGISAETRARVRLVSDGVREPAERLGAVRDLRLGLAAFGDGDPTPAGWLVAAGDNLFDFPVAGLVEAWRGREGARGAVAVEPAIPRAERPGRGLACVDDEGWVAAVEEKKAEPRCDRPVAAVYAFGPRLPAWIDAFLEEGGNPDAPGYFLEWLVGRVRIAAYPVSGYRFDIGTPERYREAREFFGDGHE